MFSSSFFLDWNPSSSCIYRWIEENPDAVGGNSWRHFHSTMPSILPVLFSFFFVVVVVVVVVYGMSSSWYTSSFIIWGMSKYAQEIDAWCEARIPKQCLLNTATTMTRWTIRSVALWCIRLRLCNNVVERRGGLSVSFTAARISSLKKKIWNCFCSPHPSLILLLILAYLFVTFSHFPKNPIRSPSSPFLSLPPHSILPLITASHRNRFKMPMDWGTCRSNRAETNPFSSWRLLLE